MAKGLAILRLDGVQQCNPITVPNDPYPRAIRLPGRVGAFPSEFEPVILGSRIAFEVLEFVDSGIDEQMSETAARIYNAARGSLVERGRKKGGEK